MFLDLSLTAMTTPSGDPTLRPGLNPATVTPGTLGFLSTLFVVVLVIFLIRDMVKRIRRVRYAAEVEQARAVRRTPPEAGPPAAGGTSPGSGQDGPVRPAPGGKHGPDRPAS